MKFILAFIIFFVPIITFADNDDADKKLSWKDFTDKTFLKRPESEFSGKKIVGSCFYQQNKTKSRKQVFPAGTHDVVFVNCNLDNVLIPTGSTVIGGCSRIICDAVDGGYIVDNNQRIVDKLDNMSNDEAAFVYDQKFDLKKYQSEKSVEPIEELHMEVVQ